MQGKIRTLIVDDSAFYRRVLVDVMHRTAKVEVVGNAVNGSMALAMIEQLVPELVTLDVEMPGINGLAVLRSIRARFPAMLVVMISSATAVSARIAIEALAEGALDFVEKPDKGNAQDNETQLYRHLRQIISVVETKRLLTRGVSQSAVCKPVPVTERSRRVLADEGGDRRSGPLEVVAIGVSTGGPSALPVVLEKLPASFHLPVLVVQHMPPMFVSVLVEALAKRCRIPVMEAVANAPVAGGVVYLAPGGKQTAIVRDLKTKQPVFQLTDDPPENFCRPAVDYLFRSVASVYGGRTLAVIMTGMGKDGTAALKLLKQAGAMTLAQDRQSSVVYGMAMEAVNAGIIDRVLPLELLGDNIVQLAGRSGTNVAASNATGQ